MTTRRHWISVVAAPLGFVALAAAAEPILIQVPAVFDPQAPISDAVRTECAVDMLLGNFVYDRVERSSQRARPFKNRPHLAPRRC